MKARRGFFVLLLFVASSARADDLTLCYNWGCLKQQTVSFSSAQIRAIQPLFDGVTDANSERTAISGAVTLFGAFAALQAPIGNDRGGNRFDEGIEGRMDCIDHSTNTTAYLNVMESRGWLKFHRVLPPVLKTRFVLGAHWSARIETISGAEQFVVDTWYLDPGTRPLMMDVERWRDYGGPHA